MTCLCQTERFDCQQGRSCPLRTKKLFWNRQQESIKRLAGAADDDKVLGIRTSQDSLKGKI